MEIRRLESYTQDELAALDQDAINRLIEIECAVEGVEREIVYPEAPEPIQQTYDVQLVRIQQMLVEPRCAEQIQALLASNNVWAESGYGASARHEIVKPEDYRFPEFTHLRIQSDRCKAEQSQSTILARKAWDAYTSAKELADEQVGKRDEVVDRVATAISQAKAAQYQKERQRSEWERFLRLSNGDITIAKQFFADRFSVAALEALGISE